VVPSRVLIALMLLFPIGGGIQHLFVFYAAEAQTPNIMVLGTGVLLRTIEILSSVSFLCGLALRLAALPALVIFLLRAVANMANSLTWLGDVLGSIIEPQGDWAFGTIYIGAIVLLSDLLHTGSGRWSVDYWLSEKHKATDKSGSTH
ncbi:MAG TPA: hypothetical protein VI566_07275, partial [Xanthomonadales bacterium]|nr:hypothetical protein [Xanthomonadales bacterium]